MTTSYPVLLRDQTERVHGHKRLRIAVNQNECFFNLHVINVSTKLLNEIGKSMKNLYDLYAGIECKFLLVYSVFNLPAWVANVLSRILIRGC